MVVTKTIEIGDAEVGTEAGNKSAEREELVIASDMKEVIKMTKDELKAYAFSRFAVKLSMDKKIKLLRVQVVNLIREKLKIPNKPKGTAKTHNNKPIGNNKRPKLLLHTGNGRVFDYTELLAKRSDMVPCDEKGQKT